MSDDEHDLKDLLGTEPLPGIAKSNFKFIEGPLCREPFADIASLKPTFLVMKTQNPLEENDKPTPDDPTDRFRPTISFDRPKNE